MPILKRTPALERKAPKLQVEGALEQERNQLEASLNRHLRNDWFPSDKLDISESEKLLGKKAYFLSQEEPEKNDKSGLLGKLIIRSSTTSEPALEIILKKAAKRGLPFTRKTAVQRVVRVLDSKLGKVGDDLSESSSQREELLSKINGPLLAKSIARSGDHQRLIIDTLNAFGKLNKSTFAHVQPPRTDDFVRDGISMLVTKNSTKDLMRKSRKIWGWSGRKDISPHIQFDEYLDPDKDLVRVHIRAAPGKYNGQEKVVGHEINLFSPEYEEWAQRLKKILPTWYGPGHKVTINKLYEKKSLKSD